MEIYHILEGVSSRFPFRFSIVQYPSIADGVIPKVAQSKRAIFNVGSALPET